MDDDQLLERLEEQALQAQAQQTLAQKILASFESSTFDAREQDYLPECCITDLVTLEAVKGELKIDETFPQTFTADQQHQFVSWILAEARKVFAITVQCDIGAKSLILSLIRFRKNKFNDTRLPADNPKISPAIASAPQSAPEHFNNPTIWTAVRLYNFYQHQWKYLVPVFCPDQYAYNLASDCIFPFTFVDGVPKVGAFSSVHRVKVHPAHQKHPGLREVAIKEIKVSRGVDKTGTDNAWELEARALKDINKVAHDHIVPCVAAIRRGDSRYFMFPWADGDSLRDFWDRTPRQEPSKDMVHQAVLQLRGLADALDRLHNFKGGDDLHIGSKHSEDANYSEVPRMRVNNEVDDYEDAASQGSIRHGDLKPENILRFLDEKNGLGVLKIADMGLAKRHFVQTQDRSHLTSTRYGTIRYEAPEAVFSLGARSRLYDIWSMGCITLEFIIWILYGNEELNNFYNQVKGDAQQYCQYFEASENPGRIAEVHGVVRQWMNHIRNTDPECTQDSAIRDLLHIVRAKLLVVPLPPNRPTSMRTAPSLSTPGIGDDITYYRATASQFRDALDEILSKVSTQPDYLLTGKARDNIKLPAPKSNVHLPLPGRPRANGPAVPSIVAPSGQVTSGVLGRHISADYTVSHYYDLFNFNVLPGGRWTLCNRTPFCQSDFD